MTTPLDKTLKREIGIEGRAYVVALSPEGLKVTLKGKRNGLELRWTELVSGEAALATALHASLGRFDQPAKARDAAAPAPQAPLRNQPRAAASTAARGARLKPSSRSARGKRPG